MQVGLQGWLAGSRQSGGGGGMNLASWASQAGRRADEQTVG